MEEIGNWGCAFEGSTGSSTFLSYFLPGLLWCEHWSRDLVVLPYCARLETSETLSKGSGVEWIFTEKEIKGRQWTLRREGVPRLD